MGIYVRVRVCVCARVGLPLGVLTSQTPSRWRRFACSLVCDDSYRYAQPFRGTGAEGTADIGIVRAATSSRLCRLLDPGSSISARMAFPKTEKSLFMLRLLVYPRSRRYWLYCCLATAGLG